MDNSQLVLSRPFNVETHKKIFIDYFEAIMLEDGQVLYAVPSHQEMLIALACAKMNISRQELSDLCPREYYCDFMNWLCQITKCVALWNTQMEGNPNERQKEVIKELMREGIYQGRLFE